MITLPNRTRLKERAAESMTDSKFNALTSLDAGDDEFLSLEARIDDTSEPVLLELQRAKGRDDCLDYRLIKGDVIYSGYIQLEEDEEDRIIAQVYLKDVNGMRVVSQPTGRTNKKKKTKSRIGYINGKFVELLKEQKDAVNYWVPTIINHIAINVDHFLKTMKGPAESAKGNIKNKYGLNADGQGAGKSFHFRRPYERVCIDIDEDGKQKVLRVDVTGTYVKPVWDKMTIKEVIGELGLHARDINPLHFENNIRKQIVQAGHPLKAIKEAYYRARA